MSLLVQAIIEIRIQNGNQIVEYSLEPSISDMDELSSFMSSANRPLGEPVGYLTKPRDDEEVNLPIYELNFAEVYAARRKIMLGDVDLLTIIESIGFDISGDNVPSQSILFTKNGIKYTVCDYVFSHSHTAVYTMEIFDSSTNEFITHTGKITVDFPDEANEAPENVSVAQKSTDGSYALNIVEYTSNVAASQRILTSSNRSAAEVPPTKNIIGSPSSEFEGVDGTDLLNFLNEYNEPESTIGDEPTVVDRDLENCISGEVIVGFQNEDEWELILDRIRDLGQGYELLEKFTANAFLLSFDPDSKTLIQALDELETVEGVSYAECNRMVTIAGENPPADETNDDAPEENQETSSPPPTTTLSGPVLAGATLLPVNDTTGFTSGDSVVIDKGTNIEETGQIASISSIVLTEPLQHNHAAGASIEKIEPVDCSAIPESCRVTIPELTETLELEDADEFIISRSNESFKVSLNDFVDAITSHPKFADKVSADSPNAGIPEAPLDGKMYVRQNTQWVVLPEADASPVTQRYQVVAGAPATQSTRQSGVNRCYTIVTSVYNVIDLEDGGAVVFSSGGETISLGCYRTTLSQSRITDRINSEAADSLAEASAWVADNS